MPDRMPENMSDRMPEDLPVTKCINVMVGITRSKVIFSSPFAFVPFISQCSSFCGSSVPLGLLPFHLFRRLTRPPAVPKEIFNDFHVRYTLYIVSTRPRPCPKLKRRNNPGPLHVGYRIRALYLREQDTCQLAPSSYVVVFFHLALVSVFIFRLFFVILSLVLSSSLFHVFSLPCLTLLPCRLSALPWPRWTGNGTAAKWVLPRVMQTIHII